MFILGDEEVKSKTCPNTQNPEWNDVFPMTVPDSRYYLRILLYDQGKYQKCRNGGEAEGGSRAEHKRVES